ncbi:MAG: hypothetical protein PHD81_02605 [Candidatus Nanoarchaeia archaeon]|nr:hypothetical protein [Candidatus Nanoarchaeia archaeon]MDD5587976.1 hypothetical protein [Candidatus Nanoarchaeia archaeon]
MNIDLIRTLEGKYTYLNRNGYEHPLKVKPINKNEVLVSYITEGRIKREISRKFPRYLKINEKFIWAMGFIEGEGLKSKGVKSSMYRFSVTNNDPKTIFRVYKF